MLLLEPGDPITSLHRAGGSFKMPNLPQLIFKILKLTPSSFPRRNLIVRKCKDIPL